MKIKFGILSIAITAVCATLAPAQQTTPADSSPNSDQTQNGRYQLGKTERANKVIGREIKGTQDQRLGSVKDLMIDLQNGRIAEVIVRTGGLLGVDEKYVAVPPEEFTCDPLKKELLLNVDKAKLTEGPSFKLSDWQANMNQASIEGVYQYYGARPYFNAPATAPIPENPNPSAETANNHAAYHQSTQNPGSNPNQTAANESRFGPLERADKVIGTIVHNVQDERLGKVDDLIVDLRAGRVVGVVLASGGFLGLGDELSDVPPQAFRPGTEANTLVLDTTKDALTSNPHFKSSEWPDFNNPDYEVTIYKSYNVQPYFADNTGQNVRDRNGNTLTPLDQGTSEADRETTRQIRKQIMATSGLSVNARNIKIITVDGKVTLRGTVNTQDEKRIIDDIAVKVASQGNVDDQLQVENTARSSAQ